MLITLLVELVGGLGLFLFGLQTMASGMQKAAGERLRRILEVLTSRPWLAVITGVIVTVLLQSSSTTTAMVVGFSNAGIMNLSQAAGTIMGANIGTTVTAQVISFDIAAATLPAIGIGSLVNFFGRRRLYKYLGQALLGLGMLIMGMTVMSSGMRPLKEVEAFQGMLVTFADIPVLGVLGGAVFTALLQSSSAATGVIIALSATEGLLTFEAALPLIVGTNLGTCITAVLASLGANLSARRAAAAHIIFNLVGIVIILTVLQPFSRLVLETATSVPRQAANAHTLFNLFNLILVFPFFKYFKRLIEKLIPGEETQIEAGAKYLDRLMLRTPIAAISATRKEVIRMAGITREMVQEATRAFLKSDSKRIPPVLQMEDLVDDLEKEITVYLSELSQHSLAMHQSNAVSRMALTANDIERIGDHAQNIAQLTEVKIEDKLPFSEEAHRELEELYRKIDEILGKAIRAFETEDVELAREVISDDDYIDEMENELRRRHIDRINAKKCYPHSGVVYLDILSNLERVADHATNIAEAVTGETGE